MIDTQMANPMIVAHPVAIAEQAKAAGLTPETIDSPFKQITRFAKEHGK